MSRRFIAALGALLLVVPAGIALAGGPSRESFHEGAPSAEGARDHMGMMANRVLDKVDATAEQRTAVDAILDEAAPTLFEQRQEMHAIRKQIKDALLQPTVDRKQVEKLRRDGLDLADAHSEFVIDTFARISEVLTPEQRATISSAIDERHKGMEGGGRLRPPGPPDDDFGGGF